MDELVIFLPASAIRLSAVNILEKWDKSHSLIISPSVICLGGCPDILAQILANLSLQALQLIAPSFLPLLLSHSSINFFLINFISSLVYTTNLQKNIIVSFLPLIYKSSRICNNSINSWEMCNNYINFRNRF